VEEREQTDDVETRKRRRKETILSQP